MSSIHWQPERVTPASAEETETPVANGPQAAKLTPLARPLLEQFLQQVSPTQGQLPPALTQSLQTLLRQLPLVLLQHDGTTTVPQAAKPSQDSGPAMQWLNRLLPQLLKLEPSLRQGLSVPVEQSPPPVPDANQPTPASSPLGAGQPTSTLQQLLQLQPPLGRALLQWALQLLSQHPRLMAQLSTQEQQQFRQQAKVTLPSQADASPPDKSASSPLSPRQLPGLLKATLPLLQPQATTSGNAARQQTQSDIAPQAKAEAVASQSPKAPAGAALSSTTDQAGDAPPPLSRALLQGVKILLQSQRPAPAALMTPTAAASARSPLGDKLSWAHLLQLAGLPDDTAPDTRLSGAGDIRPLESALPQLMRLLGGSNTLALPSQLRPHLMQLAADLQPSLDSPQQVEQWLRFMSAPLANDTALGQGLQRWLTQLLSQRLAQATSSQTATPTPPAPQDELQLGHRLLSRLGEASLQLVEQRQTAHQDVTAPNQAWLCPLPTTPQQPHEPSLTLQRGGKNEQEYHWLLSFYLEPEGVGPLQIKVRLQIPDIGIMVIAEQAKGAERVRQTLPQLESRFATLGLQSTGFHCRQGKVKPPQPATPPATDGLSIHI
ncbi:flagellar hook-length control protein FliK [Pseudaeromonas sp. ZJS20]|uniref:flagellar hook-length control protein FliK n=1 Tax=Pseudaeromonas aegiceratis TaxID=3153928 RepID=UPI00390C89DC